MKKLVLSLLTLSLGISTAAFADTPRTPRADRRQLAQQSRVVNGVRSGELTRREAVKLEVGQAQVAKVENKAKADGAVTPEERASVGSVCLVAKHTLILAVGARYRRMRSSMLAAIERGRVPAVDFLNGEVEDRGARHGVPTPVNSAARRHVHAIARGELPSAMSTVERLATEVGVSI